MCRRRRADAIIPEVMMDETFGAGPRHQEGRTDADASADERLPWSHVRRIGT